MYDIHEELQSYFEGTYGVHQGVPVQVHNIECTEELYDDEEREDFKGCSPVV